MKNIYIKGINIEFNAEYFSTIYGETERLNNEFKEELSRLKDELKEGYERGIAQAIEQGIEQGRLSKEVVFNMVMEKFDLQDDEAENYMELYW